MTIVRISCLLFLCAQFLAAQEPLKVGVVLSGGGAKGYAHVGVLKVLEEAGIRVDYIGGASMGAIVGGLYAAGWTPAQMDSLLHVTDISGALQEAQSRNDKLFFDKEYGEKYAISLSLQEFKVSLPSAFSRGQKIFELFSKWTRRVNHIRDFSKLPIPFFCTGTDVAKGEEVIMDKGLLPLAMRASGALPGLLAPVKIDGRLISDGGIVDNFPTREMKRRGVDIIIGVSVEDGLYGEDELGSIGNILMQVSSYQMVERSKEQVKYCDVYLQPEIGNYGLTSFDAVDSLIASGEVSARAVFDDLLAIAQRQQQAAPNPKNPLPFHKDTIAVDSLIMAVNPVFSRANLLAYFPVDLPGPITSNEMYSGLKRLYGTGYFNFIYYQFDTYSENKNLMILAPEIKPGYDRQLRLGLHYDPVFKSSLLLNLTFLNLGVKNSIGSIDLILGDKFRYEFNYLVKNGSKPDVGFNSYLRFNDISFELGRPIPINDSLDLEEIQLNFLDFSNEIYTRLFSNNYLSMGFAAELKYFRSSTDQILASSPNSEYATNRGFYFNGSAFFKYDTKDQISFPSRGTKIDFNARIINPLFRTNDPNTNGWGLNLDLDYHKIFPINDRFSLGFRANVGITFGDPAQPYYYLLGSNNENLINNFKPFIGLPFAKFSGTDLVSGQLYGRYRLFKNHFITLSTQRAYLNNSLNTTNNQDLNFYSVGVSYGLKTALGPIELTYGISNEESTLWFNLGYWF
ncbi:MAG: patatin [Saprospiraceae bacterium]|nr:MAG: patatin [Saprospiraceae bacterium]